MSPPRSCLPWRRPSDSYRAASSVKLCQAVLNDIWGETPRLAIDGDYGQKTDAAFRRATERLGVTGQISTATVWTRFLEAVRGLG